VNTSLLQLPASGIQRSADMPIHSDHSIHG